MRLRVAAWLAALLLAGTAHAAKAPQGVPDHPVQIPASTQWDMTSVSTGRTYRIFVAWPQAASRPPRDGYPVVYVLDGNSMFATVVEQSRREAEVGELKPAIVVGIGYSTDDPARIERERIFDLGPPVDPATLPPMLRGAKAGGANGFEKFLLEELRPRIESRFPVDRHDSTLMGHSIGGLLVLHTLFAHPQAFRNYVAISPSIWWNGAALLRGEPAFAKQVEERKAAPRILMMAGGLEQTATAGPRPPGMSVQDYAKLLDMAKMIDNVRATGMRLQALHGAAGYDVQVKVLQGDTHNSEVPSALALGLGFALQP